MADQTLEPDADVAGGEEDDFDGSCSLGCLFHLCYVKAHFINNLFSHWPLTPGNENLADSDDFDSEDEGK